MSKLQNFLVLAIIMFLPCSVFAKPSQLDFNDVEMKLLKEKNPLTDFMMEYSPQGVMKKTMEAAKSGEFDPNDPKAVEEVQKNFLKQYCKDAFLLRKTLKDDQLRFLLDNEIIKNLGQVGEAIKIVNFINKAWTGTSRQYLALTGIENLKDGGFSNFETLKEILAETKIDEKTPLGKKISLIAGNGNSEIATTKLWAAVMAGNKVDFENAIKEGADINDFAGNQAAPIHICAGGGMREFIEILLKSKVKLDVRQEKNNGISPLALAITKKQTDIAKMLVEAGADVNFPDDRETTPLIYGIIFNTPETLKFLIDHGANVNVKVINGRTPLHCAAVKGNPLIIKLLMENGADPTTKEDSGNTPLDIAKENGHEDIIPLMEKK